MTRSGRGMHFLERAYGVVYTCNQQQRSVFGFFYQTMQRHFGHSTPAPSLVPVGVG